MIQNYIFDMGNVLLVFDPDLFVQRLDLDQADRDLLLESVYRSKDWICLDEGSLTEDQVIARVQDRVPERLHQAVAYLVKAWDQPLIEIPGMSDLVKELKDQGHGIYLLSNTSQRSREYFPKTQAASCFDGGIISAEEGVIKPFPEIYHRLFDRYQLNPEECFFIDDSSANIEAGRKLGMEGFVFEGDLAPLRQAIQAHSQPPQA